MTSKAKVEPIPKGYRTVTPYLLVVGAAKFIAFAQKAFAAEVVRRSDGPNGVVMNSELKIGDSMVMCADPRPGQPGQPSMFYLYVTDCDAWYERALAAGAGSEMKPADQFYGDRNAGVKDPFGNQWWFATHLEDVSDEEIARRAAALHQKK
jgi:PhnB protein